MVSDSNDFMPDMGAYNTPPTEDEKVRRQRDVFRQSLIASGLSAPVVDSILARTATPEVQQPQEQAQNDKVDTQRQQAANAMLQAGSSEADVADWKQRTAPTPIRLGPNFTPITPQDAYNQNAASIGGMGQSPTDIASKISGVFTNPQGTVPQGQQPYQSPQHPPETTDAPTHFSFMDKLMGKNLDPAARAERNAGIGANLKKIGYGIGSLGGSKIDVPEDIYAPDKAAMSENLDQIPSGVRDMLKQYIGDVPEGMTWTHLKQVAPQIAGVMKARTSQMQSGGKELRGELDKEALQHTNPGGEIGKLQDAINKAKNVDVLLNSDPNNPAAGKAAVLEAVRQVVGSSRINVNEIQGLEGRMGIPGWLTGGQIMLTGNLTPEQRKNIGEVVRQIADTAQQRLQQAKEERFSSFKARHGTQLQQQGIDDKQLRDMFQMGGGMIGQQQKTIRIPVSDVQAVNDAKRDGYNVETY